MRKHRRFLAIGLVVISLLLSGCGTSLYELTADEEALIIKYAAHFVAKHNVYQKDGISIEVAEDESEKEDSENPDDTQEPPQGEVDKSPTVGEAMNLPKGITLVYEESYVANHITIPGYSVGAEDGFTFFILKFQMKNDTDTTIEVDNYTKNLVFKLTSGTIVSTSKNDPILSLTAFKDTINAGESVEVFLLFKVKEADATKISNPTIEIIDGKTTKPVKL